MPGISFLGMGWPKDGDYALDQRHTCLSSANLHVVVKRRGETVAVDVVCPVCGPVDYVAIYEMGGFGAIHRSQVIGLD